MYLELKPSISVSFKVDHQKEPGWECFKATV